MECPKCMGKGKRVEMDIKFVNKAREVVVDGYVCPECEEVIASTPAPPNNNVGTAYRCWGN